MSCLVPKEQLLMSRTLTLAATQRAELVHARDHDHRPYFREYAAALLKIAEGQSARQVALHGLHTPRHPRTVRRWLTKYEAGGLAALEQRPRGHRGVSPLRGRPDQTGDPAGACPVRHPSQPLAAV